MSHLCLFGLPSLDYQETLPLNTPSSVLFYLAVKADWVSRSELAFLYRPDDTETEALKYLRLQLHRAQQYPWASGLEIEKNQVRWLINTDVALFQKALEDKDWQSAIDLYKDTFFGKHSFADLATYSTWIDLERDTLEQSYRLALSKQIEVFEIQQTFREAAELSFKVWSLDALDEEVFQQHLRHLALSGQKDQALKQFASFTKLLEDELDSEPLEETSELIEQIRHDKTIELKTTRETKHNLLSQSTRFIGRKRELLELNKQLSQSECRLLSLIGLGGTGKTRLALEFARSHLHVFEDGVYFIELATLETEDAILSSLAQVLGLQFSPKESPKVQLLNLLRGKQILLVFDNFEHLIAHASLLTAFLGVSDRLKIVVTSRESLKLRGEWLFDVLGLGYPEDSSAVTALEEYEAILLFMNAAKRVVPQFEAGSDLAQIARITQQVQGLPLAIELAASWVRIMPVARIAQELEKGYELLETDLSDIPERHRNLRNVLDKTWERLSEKKRETLAKLSVFVGGCTLEAAEEVTKTHFSILLALVNEALLKCLPANRFDMHPFIRHYAAARLEQDGAQKTFIKSAHSAYYQNLVRKGGKDLCMGKDYRWQNIYLADYSNFLAVLYHSVHLVEAEQSLELCAGLWFFWFTNGKFKEGINFCHQSLELTSYESEAKAETLNGLGALTSRINLEEGKGYLKQGLAMSQRLGFKYGEQNALFYLSSTLTQQNDLPRAATYMLEALQLRKDLGYSIQQCVHNLGNIFYSQGKFQEAESHYQQALEICEENNNAYEIAIAKGSLANIAMKHGNYEKAEQLLLDSKMLYKASNDTAHLAYTEITLGAVAYHQGDHIKARAYYHTALTLGKQVSWTILVDNCYLYLALLDFYNRDYSSAKSHLNTCLASCQKNSFKREAIWANTFLLTVYTATDEKSLALQAAKEALSLLKTVDAPDDFRLFLDHLVFFAEGYSLTRTVTLFAVAETLRKKLKVLRPAREQERLDAFRVRSKQILGTKEFKQIYEANTSMNQAETINFIETFFRTL